jgi:hypothetical protein
MRTGARRFLVTVIAILAVLYLVGGVSGMRGLRSRMRAWLEPPTAAEMQRAAPDTAPRVPTAPTRARDGRKIALNEPPSTGTMIGVVVGVMIFAIFLMFATGRERQQ